jgi:hypothetical protein
VPNHAVFSSIRQRLKETGSFAKVYERDQNRCPRVTDEYVLDRIEEDLTVSTRTLARQDRISQSKAVKILHRNEYHPYYFTPVQGLQPPDFTKQVEFCH